MDHYTCHRCSRDFTFRSGLIAERMCSVCKGEEIDAHNRTARQQDAVIMHYEIMLYGKEIYFFYFVKSLLDLKTPEMERWFQCLLQD